MALGPAIPTRFTPKTVEMIKTLANRLDLDEADIIRRCVETALTRVEVSGDYRFLMEKTNMSLVAETPTAYAKKRKSKE